MLILSITCTRFETNYSSYTVKSMKIYVAAVEALKQEKRKTG